MLNTKNQTRDLSEYMTDIAQASMSEFWSEYGSRDVVVVDIHENFYSAS